MKPIPPALQARLDAGATTLAWCWRIDRRDGVSLGFTDHDRPLAFGGVTFEPGAGFAAAELRATADLSVDAQEASGALRSERIAETDVLDGLWDGAEVRVWRVDWTDVALRVLMRRGAIGQVRRGRSAFVAEVRSMAHVLNQPVGRTFQAGCDAALGDARCGVDLDAPAFRGSGTVTALIGDRAFAVAGLEGFAPGLFERGALAWTSGANAGRSAEVAGHGTADGVATLALAEAPLRPPAPGDGFAVRAGCDKRLETCRDRFANVANFRGFPHLPGQDAMLRYAVPGEGGDGGGA